MRREERNDWKGRKKEERKRNEEEEKERGGRVRKIEQRRRV